jgi:hypothetical protein
MTILGALTSHCHVVTVHDFDEFSVALYSIEKIICGNISKKLYLPWRRICSFRGNMCEHRDQLEDCVLVLSLSWFPR